jgi:hypothetical protein
MPFKIDTQLNATANTQPMSPVKNITSMMRTLKSTSFAAICRFSLDFELSYKNPGRDKSSRATVGAVLTRVWVHDLPASIVMDMFRHNLYQGIVPANLYLGIVVSRSSYTFKQLTVGVGSLTYKCIQEWKVRILTVSTGPCGKGRRAGCLAAGRILAKDLLAFQLDHVTQEVPENRLLPIDNYRYGLSGEG